MMSFVAKYSSVHAVILGLLLHQVKIYNIYNSYMDIEHICLALVF